MAHDHRGRPVGRPWMHEVADMRKQSRSRMWTMGGEQAHLNPEDLEGLSSVYRSGDHKADDDYNEYEDD